MSDNSSWDVMRDCVGVFAGLMSELLWSDPQPFQGVGPSKRGIGVSFGPDVTRDFLKHNGLGTVEQTTTQHPHRHIPHIV